MCREAEIYRAYDLDTYYAMVGVDESYGEVDGYGVEHAYMEGAAFVFNSSDFGGSSSFTVEIWRECYCVATQVAKAQEGDWSTFGRRREAFFKAVYRALRDAAYSVDSVKEFHEMALDTLLCAVVFADDCPHLPEYAVRR